MDCDNVGWVKIDQECIGYSGVTGTAGQTTLTNLVRAQCDTADVLHNSAAGVAFCVGYPRADVLGRLYDRAMAWMHTMFSQGGCATGTDAWADDPLFGTAGG